MSLFKNLFSLSARKKFRTAALCLTMLLTLAASCRGADFTSTKAGENALALTDGSSEVYNNITVSKIGDADSEDADFYGTNAAVLSSNGSTLTITGASTEITTNGAYANAVFAYDSGTVDISNATIRTQSNNSGGIMTTGGGIMKATNLTVTTLGNSSAAIRSDRGGGDVTVDGGTYTTSGRGSPAIYSTAKISVSNATLKSNIAQGVVVEGKNSVTLKDCTMDANHTTLNGQDTTHQAVLLYQSMSGDASEGLSSFSMTNGSLTNAMGDIFHVTNTTSNIELSNVAITNNDATGIFLRAASDSWGNTGSNGGKVTLNASDQIISGDIIVDSLSSLVLRLKDNSVFSGAINPGGTAGLVSVIIEEGSVWNMTGNSHVTSLDNAGDLIRGSHTLTVNNEESDGNGGSAKNRKTSSSGGCDASVFGAAALAALLPAFLYRKK